MKKLIAITLLFIGVFCGSLSVSAEVLITVVEVYRKKHNIVDIIIVLCYNFIMGDDNYDQ